MIQGFDLSHWQENVDFDVAKAAGIQFSISKCTDGDSFVDDTHKKFHAGAQRVGMVTGFYHFWRYHLPPREQAELIKKTIGNLRYDLPIAIDCEGYQDNPPMSNKERTNRLISLLVELHNFNGHKRPIIYTSAGWWNNHINSMDWQKTYPLWVANWNAPAPMTPTGWDSSKWAIWQYKVSNAGYKYGVSARKVDLNQWNEELPFPSYDAPPPPEPSLKHAEIVVNIGGRVYSGITELKEIK